MRTPAYWNHNVAYHDRILQLIKPGGRALDVGCGEGLLVERLAARSASVTGIDIHAETLDRARRRCDSLSNVTLENVSFAEYGGEAGYFDLITFVASLHHVELRASLVKVRELLAPGGDLAVVGLSARSGIIDVALSTAAFPAVRLASWLHHETRDIGVPVLRPVESLAEIRAVAAAELPGATVGRGLYYRYVMRWRRPN